jgi:hypothetical protein
VTVSRAAATAFDLLRRASQNRNRKLRDIATDIITRVSGAPPEPRPAFKTTAADVPLTTGQVAGARDRT